MTISPPLERPVAAPLHRMVPSGRVSSAATEAVELAASAGLVLDDWQVEVLDAALSERADGKWAAREVALICPRQNGKGAILEAVELAGLYLFDEKLILHSAHEFKTATESFLRVWHLIETTPDLERLVYRKLQNNNDMSIELTTGQRLRFVARTGGSGRGFSGDRIILDEAFNLPDRALAALMPTLSARPNPQVWYTSSAPLPTADSDVLRRLCKRGREQAARFCYFEYAAKPDRLPSDRDGWYEGNPALGIEREDGSGIGEEDIEAELATMSLEDFTRERLGHWSELGTGTVLTAELWSACLNADYEPQGVIRYALDVSPDGRSAAVAASDGIVVEIVKADRGLGWVVPACVAKLEELADGLLIDPAGPAGALVQDLRAANVPVQELTVRDGVQACGEFLAAVTARTVCHVGQPELDVAVANADRRDIGDGGWMWSRKRSNIDISPLVAATFAFWAARARIGDPTASVF